MNNVSNRISTTDDDEAAEPDDDFKYFEIKVPTGTYGFVYMLSSCSDTSIGFISHTSNLNHRLCQHNRSNYLFNLDKRPYFLVSYMSYLDANELSYNDRVSLQQRWIDNCATIIPSDDDYHNIQAISYQGSRAVTHFNSMNTGGHKLWFHTMIPATSELRNFEDFE